LNHRPHGGSRNPVSPSDSPSPPLLRGGELNIPWESGVMGGGGRATGRGSAGEEEVGGRPDFLPTGFLWRIVNLPR